MFVLVLSGFSVVISLFEREIDSDIVLNENYMWILLMITKIKYHFLNQKINVKENYTRRTQRTIDVRDFFRLTVLILKEN